MLGTVTHQPTESKKYEIDYSQWMDVSGGEVLSAVTVTVSPATTPALNTIGALSTDQLKVELTVYGGKADESYEVSILATTSYNQREQECLGVFVTESC